MTDTFDPAGVIARTIREHDLILDFKKGAAFCSACDWTGATAYDHDLHVGEVAVRALSINRIGFDGPG